MGRKSIRDYGYIIGEGTPGSTNRITDVPGVKVGHTTVDTARNHTGVTVIIPCDGIVYLRKPVAAVYTLNGYGKTAGSIQIGELGTIETPIALTNTLNVGKVCDALVGYTIDRCRSVGRQVHSVNPVVGETNDHRINDIEERVIGRDEVLSAIDNAGADFAQGSVGAGRGTVCFDLKGGIGSASRLFSFGNKTYTLGALVQSNFGTLRDLTICGEPVGRRINGKLCKKDGTDCGSIMIVLGTDIPLSARQLGRVLRRASVGLIRTGSHMGHGSGDVFLGFTNGNFMPDEEVGELLTLKCLPEESLDKVFRLAAEAVEEAILNSMTYADAAVMTDGTICHSLSEYL